MKTKAGSMNPFPGLRPFRQEEDYLFFGREEQTMELLKRLGMHRFVAVVGTSGSGKSSLVRCGLLSELLGGKLLRAGASWEVAVTHPGGNPLALLAEAILEADLYEREEEHAREHLLATLSRSQFGLIEAVRQARLGEGTNFLLVVDQFEEIFRFNEAGQTQQEMASEFVSLLLEAVGQTEVSIYIVITMRSDFIGDCGQFEGLAEMVNQGEFLIPRLSREQFKRVIEAPIKVAGGQIAPRLLQRLLNDLGQQADQLPCLQHALMRTWSVWSERGDTEALDLDDYQLVGRMSEALSLHADEIFASLENDRQRELCAGMFKALTVQESEKRGIRRPQRLGGLCQILEVSADELRPIIDAYRQQNVTFLMPSPEVELTDKTIIDISHESLMRVWTRLRHWVEEEAQAVGIYRRLSESAVLHDDSKAGLYRDPELGIALAWREATRPNQAWAERYHPGFVHAMEFLDASQEAHLAEEQALEAARQRELAQARMLAEAERARAELETRAARRLRMLLAGTALIAVFAVGASAVAVKFWSDADRAKEAAQLSERSARENAQAARSEAARATAQETAAKEARREAEIRAYTATLAAATADLQRNDSQTIRRRLEQTPEQFRGWEWAYLWNESDRSLKTVIELPPEKFGYNMDVSRDSRFVASRPSGGHDKPVTVYDTRTGEKVAILKTASSSHPLMTFSADNRLLAYHHWGIPGVQIYEIATARQIVPEEVQRNFNSFLGFDPPGARAVVLDRSGKLRVFSTLDWSPMAVLPGDCAMGDAETRRRGAISPDGQLLVVGANKDDPMRIYDLQSNTLVKEIPESTTAIAVKFNDAGDSVTTVAAEGTITEYSVSGWRKVAETREHRQQRGDIAVHRLDGQPLWLSFDSNGAVALFDGGLARSATLRGRGASGLSIAVDSELEQIVTAHRDGAVCRWDLRHPRDLRLSSREVAFTPDGTVAWAGLVASAGNDATQLCGIDVTSGRILGYLRWYPFTLHHGSDAAELAYSPDRRRVAVATRSGWGQGRWRIYDLWTGIAEHEELPWRGDLECIDWSADGRWVAVGGDKYNENAGVVRIYDARSYRQMAQIDDHTGAVHAVAFSHDSQRLVTAAEDGTLRVWEVPTGTSLFAIGKQGDSALNCLVNTPDGHYVVAGSTDGTVAVRDPLDGREVFRSKVHGAAVTCLAFTPDGTRLVTAAADRSMKIFDSESWRELVTLHLEETARAMSFSPDGKRLAMAMGSLFFLDTEKESVRSNERRLARDKSEQAKSLVKNVLQKTDDPIRAREQIVSDVSLDDQMRQAALRELRIALEDQWKGSYEAKNLYENLWPRILREQFVFSPDDRPSESQVRNVIGGIRSSTGLDAIGQQALLEFATAYLKWPPEDTNAMVWEIVSNPGRSPDDYLLAYFGMGAAVRESPQDAGSLNTMALAEYRVGLYRDAQESAERSEASSRDASGPSPQNLAVIAMSQHQTGQTEVAVETIRKLGEVMKQPQWSAQQGAIALSDEAKKVLETPVERPWNEQDAWESCKRRMLQMKLDEAKCALWQAWSAERIARRHSAQGGN